MVKTTKGWTSPNLKLNILTHALHHSKLLQLKAIMMRSEILLIIKHTINLTTEPESLGRMNSLMLLSLLADQKKSVSFPSLQKAKVISYHYPPNNSVITVSIPFLFLISLLSYHNATMNVKYIYINRHQIFSISCLS